MIQQTLQKYKEVFVNANEQVSLHVHVHSVCTDVYADICTVYMYVCMYVCMYVQYVIHLLCALQSVRVDCVPEKCSHRE